MHSQGEGVLKICCGKQFFHIEEFAVENRVITAEIKQKV